MKNLRSIPIALAVTFLCSACAHSHVSPKLDRSSNLDLSSIAKRFGVPNCKVSVPLNQEEVLRAVKLQGIPHPENRADWTAMVEALKPGDQLRQVICLTKGKGGAAAGDVFFGLFRDREMVAEIHTVIIN